MTVGIYRLVFKNTDKCYIGQSVNIEKRFNQHILSFNKNTATKKLLSAFLSYGTPVLEILCECLVEDLDQLEEEAILIFDSVNNGFNVYSFSGEAPVLKGTESGNAKYTKQQLIAAYSMLANTLIPYKEIAVRNNINYDTIIAITKNQQHLWLKEQYPEMYIQIEINRKARSSLADSSRKTYNTQNYSAKAKGIVYPPIISPTGEKYLVYNIQEFARNHGISKSSLHRLLHKVVLSHKGWKVC